ncbi:FAD-dependent oxidoreductase [Thermophilibacter sp. ZX-H3]|uniref:FAD-dependent oxidoreductase n=1 Tax=unclassified Thermophilibacter TaxID=2847308 RepID=UPI004040A6AA
MARQARRVPRSRAREEALAAAAAVRVADAYDVAVVGGGASGLAAAIAAAEAGASVVVLERDVACGRTILATGNGRCNFMNARLCGPAPAWGRYNDPAFVEAVSGPGFGDDVLSFFEGCGLAWAEEEGGRLYPLSRQAASVREVLLARARRAGVVLAPAREVTDVSADGTRCRITCQNDPKMGGKCQVMSSCAVLSLGGGPALAPSLGTLGLELAPFGPVLCSLACEPEEAGVSLAELDGRRAHVTARLLRDGAEVAREEGEALFRPYGLSGIVTFDLSRAARAGDVISLDLTCGMDPSRARRLARAAGGCAGLVDPVIARALGGDVERVRDLRFAVRGPAEPERAQVTRGGLATRQFDPATLEARALPGLFACGEALDVDGACGGYNLAWAWKSGLVAGRAAAESAGRRA